MPYTVGLSEQRVGSPLARCRGRNDWNTLERAEKAAVCKDCPLRLHGELSCNADFITITDIEVIRDEIVKTISWVLNYNPAWVTVMKAYAETTAALGLSIPEPKAILLNHLRRCKPGKEDPDFWRDWNRIVEYFEGSVVVRSPSDSPGNMIVNDLVTPRSWQGYDLRSLCGAVSVIWAAARYLGYHGVREMFATLSDACRRAVLADCPLEVN